METMMVEVALEEYFENIRTIIIFKINQVNIDTYNVLEWSFCFLNNYKLKNDYFVIKYTDLENLI